MLQDQKGIDRRQNMVVNGLQTIQQSPVRAVGAGMGARDQAVRMAHRDRARIRSVEDPRYSHWRGGAWWDDAWSGIKKGAEVVGNVARPFVETVGNKIGEQFGVSNAGTIADQGLKLAGLGKPRMMTNAGYRRKRRMGSKLAKKRLQEAVESGLPFTTAVSGIPVKRL
jgi:hypothetical protein